jgi:hypothetical protein
MNKSLLAITTAILVIVIGSSSINVPKSVTASTQMAHTDGYSVTGYSGGCTSCHGSATSAGGGIALVGVPDTTIAGQRYTVSVTLTDAAQQRWGFDMKVGSGSFTSSNPNVGIGTSTAADTSGTNIHHGSSAPVAAPAATGPSYIFDSIFWTAPTKTGTVKFAFAGVAANNNNSSSGDHCYKGTFSTVVIANTLPVKIESFDAVFSNGEVKISWLTANELNTDHFEVEKSTDKANFTTVGKVAASGNSNAAKDYSYTDNSIILGNTVYYRLKSVDKTGAFTYSNVVSVSTNAVSKFITNLYPNPLSGGQNLKLTYLSEKAENVNLQVINLVGKKVSATNVSVNEGSNALSLPVGHLAPGVYYVVVSVNNAIVQKTPVVIQ